MKFEEIQKAIKRVSEKPQELNKKVRCLKRKGKKRKTTKFQTLIMVTIPETILHMFYVFIHHAVYFAYPNLISLYHISGRENCIKSKHFGSS